VKDFLAAQVRSARTPLAGRQVAREYIQARILASLQRQGAMVPLAFHGGTALRFLYHIPRFSEDLDFALERPARGYDFRRYLHAIRAELVAEGYTVELRVSDQKTVHGAFIRLPGLLNELGLSALPAEVLAVKIEVDTRPPAGAGLATTVIRRHVTLNLQHHDGPSLLAGKLHALLQRPYLKGRDVFDLLWYLSDPDWPPPNLDLLNNALQQTGWPQPTLTADTWRTAVARRLTEASWDTVRRDVEPLLDPSVDPGLVSRDTVLQVLGR
jgi:hypothetical protein